MEIWKNFDNFYEVSSFGNVRSKQRLVKSTHGGFYVKEGRVLKQTDNSCGYLQVSLCYNGKCRSERVHRLVALVFVENPLRLPVVNHLDSNRHNNTPSNLEWCMQSDNVKHATEKGKYIAEYSPNRTTKLVHEDVVIIKKMLLEGKTNYEIADLFGVHAGTIQCIRSGRNWKHVKIG